MRFRRFTISLGAAALAAGCSNTPLPEIPTGIRPRAAAMQPDVAARLFAEIESERGRISSQQTAEEAACYQRFVVNSCLLEVRARYRPQLNALNQRETQVRAGERELHEEERVARMEEQRKQSEADEARARQRAASAVPPGQRQAELDQRNADRAAQAPGNAAQAQANRSSAQQQHEKAVADQIQRAQAAPGEREQYEARQKAAADRRAAQARRAAEPKTKPAAQPLPAIPTPPTPPMQTP
jgi:hypothetical protein